MSGPIVDVDIEELASGLADGTIALVDVREPHEFAAGRIPGSVSVPLSSFDVNLLPRQGRVVFSCGSGVRSKVAIERSRAAGLDLNEHFPGGFRGWVAAGGPVSHGDD